MNYENALPNDSENARLYARVKSKLNVGEQEQLQLIHAVSSMVIRDKLVPPKSMEFLAPQGGQEALKISYKKSAGAAEVCTIHKHALTQLAQKVDLPVIFAAFLNNAGWKRELLAHNLTTLFHETSFFDRSGQPKFLHRIVGTELRGFLSRRFNRHIASAPLLRAFIDTCASMGAFPFEATASDVKVALKCMLPHVFEPVKGEFVCAGVEWSNSDFGAGRMQVALSLWMPLGDRFTVLDHVISRVHIGSVIEDTDIELSEETSKKEADAQSSAIRDSVVGQLSPESIDRLLKAITSAHEEKISWDKLKGQLSRFLNKRDVESLQKMLEEESVDLPPVPKVDGEAQPTKWWASSALSWLANRAEGSEKKLDLQHAAGGFLEVK